MISFIRIISTPLFLTKLTTFSSFHNYPQRLTKNLQSKSHKPELCNGIKQHNTIIILPKKY